MKTITIQVPDDCDVQIVRSKNKFKKGDVIVTSYGNIAIYEEIKVINNMKVVYYSTLYVPSDRKFRKLNEVDRGIVAYENDCHLATKEQKELLINALKTEAKTNNDAKIVLKEVFNIEVEPVIRTYQDLIDNKVKLEGYFINSNSGIVNPRLLNIKTIARDNNRNVAISNKVAKSMLAMAQISQLMPYYGGAISDEEWTNNESKYVIVKIGGQIQTDDFYRKYHFPAFHTKEQRDDFLKYNERLVKDYLMID